MGIRKWLDSLTSKKDNTPEDPAAAQKRKREENAKKIRRIGKAVELAGKASAVVDDASRKAGELKDAAVEKLGDKIEAVKPAADAIDAVTGAAANKAKELFAAAAKKAAEIKEDQARKPSTGSGLLDTLVPGVPPEADNKKKKPDQPPPAP